MLGKIKDLLQKYRHILSYLFFGVATTGVNWVVYTVCVSATARINLSNVIAWLCAVIFAYITNKIFVFHSQERTMAGLAKEIGLFFSSRIFSGLVEILGVPFLMWCGLRQTVFGIEGMAAKVAISVIVVILNYVLSKILVFKKA